MKINFLIFLFFIISFTTHADVVQVNCVEDQDETSEILKLFSVMKNSVLGTVPKFCREDKPDQLGDENISSKQLTDFVAKLKTSMKGVADTTPLDKHNETKKDAVLLNTFRIVIIKKIWKNLDEDGRLKILISDDCSKYGLNRTILNKSPIKGNGNKLTNPDQVLKTMNTACKISNFTELAPFLSKEVLAEGLFNLKKIFPTSFPILVDNLCGVLKNTDELIYKEDMYSELSSDGKDAAESQDFSNWLKGLYLEVGKNNGEHYQSFEMNVQKLKEVNEVESELPGSTANLEAVYKAAKSSGKKEKDIKHPSFGGFLVVKADDGKYILKLDPSQNYKMADNSSQILENQKYQQQQHKNAIEIVKQQMEAIYNKAQTEGNAPNLVPYPGRKGFFIGKKEDGTLYLHLDDEAKLISKKILENYQELLRATDFELSDNIQNIYRLMYEGQQKYGEGYYDPTLQLPYKKIIMKDGLYLPEPTAVELTKADLDKQFLLTNFAPLFQDKENLALPIGQNNLMLINKKNEMATLAITEEILTNLKLTPEQIKLKKAQPLTLVNTLKSKFQKKTTDKNKLKNLSSEEAFAISEYTSNGYGELNTCLRNDSCSQMNKQTIDLVVSGIQKLKSEERKNNKDEYITLYRGSHLPGFILQNLNKEPKNFVLDKGFMSTSGDAATAKGFGPDILIMKTKSCIGISVVSSVPEEDEFLCPPGLKFNVKKQPGNENVYLVEEVN